MHPDHDALQHQGSAFIADTVLDCLEGPALQKAAAQARASAQPPSAQPPSAQPAERAAHAYARKRDQRLPWAAALHWRFVCDLCGSTFF